jgi:hypothetical protein
MAELVKLIKIPMLFLVLLASIYGCTGSPDLVSQPSVEDKVTQLHLGKTDKKDVEGIFGTDHSNDRNRWVYSFSDRQFQIFERTSGPVPITAGVMPTNTRALVTIVFNEAGVVKRIEFARFFDEPYVNDYWYLLKSGAQGRLETVVTIGESIGFKATRLDKDAGTFTLEDPVSKARLAVKLDGETLRITSHNPYNRLGNEYRVYTKREGAFTDGIADSAIVQ